MKPTIFVLLLGVTLGGVALGTPLYAQTGHVSVGAWFTTGQQYPQGPPAGGYGYPQRPGSPSYPGRPGDGRSHGDGEAYGYGYDNYARSTGYRDGYEKGFDASRERDRFDPRRERWYREGDRGYRREAYMSRDQYKNLYRRAFADGYEAGYRDARRGSRSGRYGNPAPRGGWEASGGWR
jgi:hypothetical protein